MTPYWKAINARKTMKPSLLLALLIITAASADDLFNFQPDVSHPIQAMSTSEWS